MSHPYEYYIEEDFATLAGPYDPQIKREMRFLSNVVEDMKRGNIPYRIVEDDKNRMMVQRKGMILPKNGNENV
jgi:hypothetical protein